LFACALGRKRAESVDDLAALRFGVRIDQGGRVIRDFHMTHKEWGPKTEQSAFLSERYYLADAIFLAGVEGDDSLLTELDAALCNPVFPLFLGRRSCPPAGGLSLGIREGITLEDALREENWIASDWYKRRAPDPVRLELVIDAPYGEEVVSTIRDMPLSFDQSHRRYGFRNITRAWVELPNARAESYHNAMEEIDYVSVTHSD
jgi:CRISPR system Cascade subunit CasD